MQLSSPTTRLIARTHRDPPVTPRRSRHRARSLGLTLGVTLAVIGSLAAITGGALLTALGTDGRLASGPRLLSTPTDAIVAPVSSIQNAIGVEPGTPTLRISTAPVPDARATFIGIARAADVDRYLAPVTTRQADELGFRPYTNRGTGHDGRRHAQAPTMQRFWVAHATSDQTAKINWKITNDRYRVVIMNANGQDGIATSTTIATTDANVPVYAIAAMIAGLLIAGTGSMLLIRTTGGPRRPNSLSRLPNASPATTA